MLQNHLSGVNSGERKLNVLSLFDGMSCGMIALDRLGIKVDNYYASEIDKYAMQVSKANYPEIIQVGDITKLDLSTLPKIDLVMGGSPCQGFSFAGKQLAFDDPRSALFFEFQKAISYLQPKYFLLENVKMKKEYLDIISEYMGVEPIFINSSLVSAQSRQRYYWTNIPGIEQPKERGIVLRDILEKGFNTERDKSHCLDANYYKGSSVENYLKKSRRQMVFKDFENSKMTTKDGKAYCITARYTAAEPKNSIERKQRTMIPVEDGQELPKNITLVYDYDGKSHKPQHIGTAVDVNGHDILKRVYSPDGKSPTVNSMGGGNREPKVVVGAYRGRYNEDGSTSQKLELRKDEKTNTITTVQKDNVLTQDEVYWRKLTPLECMRLQTVQDDYLMPVSNTQKYKLLGNGWTIEVIAHILKNMEA
jgi:DNA (cytosine-5)-methyltransferase 3A